MFNREEAEAWLAEGEHARPSWRAGAMTRLAAFELRLHEAAVWCEQNADMASVRECLRPWRLAPHLLSRHRWELVDDVAAARHTDLRGASVGGRRPPGRLLVYFPDAELRDGAAEAESQGFFDGHNAPPWGTWVAYFEDHSQDVSFASFLLAWVPQRLISLADAGIEANPEQCILWVGDAHPHARLRAGWMAQLAASEG